MENKIPSPVYYSGVPKPNGRDRCVTQVKLKKFSFEWTVTNFSVCTKMRESLKSSEFPASECFRLYLRLNMKDREKYYDVKLTLAYPLLPNPRAEVKFSFLNSKRVKINLHESQIVYLTCGQEDGYTYRFTKEELMKNNLLSGDKLTILTEVTFINEKINISSQEYIAYFKCPENKLVENFESILEKEKFCDVKFAVGDHTLQAHKAILAARSVVFAAMFDHEMQENNKNIVTITDINHNVLKEMLHFIYTGKAPKIDQMALDLLPVADKYALAQLKSMCEIALYRTLMPETAAETLILSDRHGAKELKNQTINFIKVYMCNVEKTPGWQNLIKEHPKLVTEIDLKKSLKRVVI